jgi:hypothetical protein
MYRKETLRECVNVPLLVTRSLLDCLSIALVNRYKAHFRWEHYGQHQIDTSAMKRETDPCASVSAAFLKVRTPSRACPWPLMHGSAIGNVGRF